MSRKTNTDILEKQLKIEQLRYNVALRAEATTGRVSSETSRIAIRIETLRAKIAEASQPVTAPNEGAAMLSRVPLSRREIARQLGVSAPMTKNYIDGVIPTTDVREQAESRFQIPVLAWDRPAGWVADAPAPAPAPVSVPDEPTDTRGRLVAQTDRLRALLMSDLSSTNRIATERALGAALGAVAKLDGMHISESTIVNHPAHQAVMRRVLSAVSGWPLVLAAVSDELHRAQGDAGGAVDRIRRDHAREVLALEKANEDLRRALNPTDAAGTDPAFARFHSIASRAVRDRPGSIEDKARELGQHPTYGRRFSDLDVLAMVEGRGPTIYGDTETGAAVRRRVSEVWGIESELWDRAE